ncbi:hypothetical protein ACJX0J_036748, partial [Zea mays]
HISLLLFLQEHDSIALLAREHKDCSKEEDTILMQQLYIDDDVIDRSIRKTSGILIGFIYLAFETVSAAYIYIYIYVLHILFSFFLSFCQEKCRVLTISPDIFNTPAATRYMMNKLQLLWLLYNILIVSTFTSFINKNKIMTEHIAVDFIVCYTIIHVVVTATTFNFALFD